MVRHVSASIADGDRGGGLEDEPVTAALGESTGGVWQLGDAAKPADPANATAARPRGEPLWLEWASGHMTVSDDQDAFQEIRDGGATLAEVPELVALAEAMDSEQVYSALINLGSPQTDQPVFVPQPLWKRIRGSLLEPFLGVAVGLAHDGDQPYVVLAHAHDDPATAGTNAEAVRALVEQGRTWNDRPWSDRFAVDDVRVDGTTVVVRLAPRDGYQLLTAYGLLRSGETLAIHRETMANAR